MNIENPTATSDQFGFRSTSFSDFCRHTDGFGLVVSNTTIFDDYFHAVSLTLILFGGNRDPSDLFVFCPDDPPVREKSGAESTVEFNRPLVPIENHPLQSAASLLAGETC